jgi:FkbM family methyltransferase
MSRRNPLKGALRAGRALLAGVIGWSVVTFPSLEPTLVRLGRAGCRRSRVAAGLYWFAQESLLARLRTRGERYRSVTVLGRRLQLDITDRTGRHPFFYGTPYEPGVTDVIVTALRAGDVFVDVGANVGYFTLLAAALTGPEGRVIAFEPNPANCAVLERSLAANAFTNVELHPYAAAERRMACALEIAGTNSNGTLLDAPVGTDAAQHMAIEAVAIDDVLGALPRVDIVKMDIEGAEPRAFQGMRELVRLHRPVLITEFSPELIERVSRVAPVSFLDQLRAADYELFVLGPAVPPEDRAQNNEEILALHARSGMTHLDLLAAPRTLRGSP